jgi:hypothetical protein
MELILMDSGAYYSYDDNGNMMSRKKLAEKMAGYKLRQEKIKRLMED